MRRRKVVSLIAALPLVVFVAASAQQVADPNFDTKVAKPAYDRGGPRVLFDEAHNNFHTATGRYKPFADLITSDGYRVTPNAQKLTRDVLKPHDIFVTANALGAPAMNTPEASNPAFTDEECDAVRDWVRGGGSLLLIADHAPIGAANANLGRRFGVEMSNAYTIDPANASPGDNNLGFIVYTRERGIMPHPVTDGRNAEERVGRVIAFTGQSLKGPAGSFAFMRLADTARDVVPSTEQNTSAAGRVQGLAINFGKGRVVVMAEAAMLSAQLAGPNKVPFGMNRPGIDNRRLALNILHWLSRKI